MLGPRDIKTPKHGIDCRTTNQVKIYSGDSAASLVIYKNFNICYIERSLSLVEVFPVLQSWTNETKSGLIPPLVERTGAFTAGVSPPKERLQHKNLFHFRLHQVKMSPRKECQGPCYRRQNKVCRASRVSN
ncbi:hypothetical protein IscW_ISCW000763 [Ixodes scapularis]|uniref:Uncharacterized protein n=1 Tax=Ixodes scapularis TaxID=6945 RepID=B7P5M0_IXOSC|nr:hypothetical protein IscW_ISCW000763 [Ixodes scapularis]|eukprot:XP_002407692.1 hypothetical protein IscW_ISCW000763 [Ixodes scapularis]